MLVLMNYPDFSLIELLPSRILLRNRVQEDFANETDHVRV